MRPSMHRHANTTNAFKLLLRFIHCAVRRVGSDAESEADTGSAPCGV